jgi:ring-1,2-phenylacetyl-CoA epoxidase subunit PaaC
MISAIKEVWPLALGMFESWVGEENLSTEMGPNGQAWYSGEAALRLQWQEQAFQSLQAWGVDVDQWALSKLEPVLGGRQGFHTEHLAPLLEEMTAVFRLDPQAEW